MTRTAKPAAPEPPAASGYLAINQEVLLIPIQLAYLIPHLIPARQEWSTEKGGYQYKVHRDLEQVDLKFVSEDSVKAMLSLARLTENKGS